jgi:hypothetical protein
VRRVCGQAALHSAALARTGYQSAARACALPVAALAARPRLSLHPSYITCASCNAQSHPFICEWAYISTNICQVAPSNLGQVLHGRNIALQQAKVACELRGIPICTFTNHLVFICSVASLRIIKYALLH